MRLQYLKFTPEKVSMHLGYTADAHLPWTSPSTWMNSVQALACATYTRRPEVQVLHTLKEIWLLLGGESGVRAGEGTHSLVRHFGCV
jgi:hypothetical protein